MRIYSSVERRSVVVLEPERLERALNGHDPHQPQARNVDLPYVGEEGDELRKLRDVRVYG